MQILLAFLRTGLKQPLCIACLLILALVVQQLELLKKWERPIFDAELSLFSRPNNDATVIVAIDDHSLKTQGKWPWSRRIHAELIKLLTAAEVKAIGLDIVFSEPDLADPAADQELVTAVQNNGHVILPALPEISGSDDVVGVTLPFQELANAAAGLGHVDVEIDNDGLVRSVYLMAGTSKMQWPAFSLALHSLGQQKNRNLLNGERNSEAWHSLESWHRDYRIEVPFAGNAKHFRKISYADVLSNPGIRAELRGKTILVGATAAGLAPMFTTSMSKNTGLISGVELNANVLDVLQNEIAIRPLPSFWSLILTAFLVFIPVLGYVIFFPRKALSISLLFAGLTIALSACLMKGLHFWYSPMPVLFTLFIAYLAWNWHRLKFFTQSLFKERQLAKAILHSTADAMITTNAEGLIVYMNPAAEKLTGTYLELAKGTHIDSVVRFIKNEDKNPERQFNDFIHNLLNGQSIKETVPRYIVNNSGHEYAVQVSGNPIRGESEKISGTVFALSDITETLKISSKINYLATHDPLTGLPNRVLFYEQLEKAIANCNRQGNHLALLFIDLDDFKKVNDGMGHPVGDMLLIEVASRLLTNMRQTDTVARWGGDEFVALLSQLPIEENIAGIAVKILERLSQPYHIENQTLYVTPSIGISIYPKDGVTSEELLGHADAALFQVKEQGRNNFIFFSRGFNKAAKQRLVMEKEMYSALEEGQFEVFYQPQVEIKTNRIIGAEALLRWHHPEKGIILPSSFIPLAEENGLINAIGDWVLQSVCKQINSWQNQGINDICVAINLSARQFFQEDLCDKIKQSLKNNNAKGCFLKVEITESLMIKNIDMVAKMLWEIRAMGVSISIDDFGTGYSSLSALKNFPIDQLKIDKSFVCHLGGNSDDTNIAQSIIMLGHNMCMTVVAEGVENKLQLDLLSEWNCDFIQGYFFSRPLSSVDMTEFLMNQKNNPKVCVNDPKSGS